MVVVGGGPGHQFVHPMKREKRDKQQLAVLTALSRLALYDDEVDVVVVCRQGGLRRRDLARYLQVVRVGDPIAPLNTDIPS